MYCQISLSILTFYVYFIVWAVQDFGGHKVPSERALYTECTYLIYYQNNKYVLLLCIIIIILKKWKSKETFKKGVFSVSTLYLDWFSALGKSSGQTITRCVLCRFNFLRQEKGRVLRSCVKSGNDLSDRQEIINHFLFLSRQDGALEIL